MKLNAAAIQMEPTFGDIEGNLERLGRFMAANQDADLMVAPELVTTGYDVGRLAEVGHELAEPVDGNTVRMFSSMARDLHATLVAGFLEAGTNNELHDSVVIASESGTTIYRKTHLYPPEASLFAAGDHLVTSSTPGGTSVGVMICFEHAFPEIATTLALDGAEIIAIPSAVPRGYEHLLQLRTRARAQDNQVFVVASNLTGGDFEGGSLIVDPRGEVLATAGPGEGSVIVEIDLASIAQERSKEPALRLRRTELYR